jgi:Dolichyl-phosphate-mannose-protein mannosyltransferase
LSAQILAPTTAGINPEQFDDGLFFTRRGIATAVVLTIVLLIGFTLRVNHLGTESLGEDEYNKLQTAQEYRTHGLSGKNGEHPFLMKGMQTLSLMAADTINGSIGADISEEAALRFPVALFGTFTILLLFFLTSEMFGKSIGLVSATLWAVEPIAAGFDRIAKEDSLVLFFFLLASLFLLKSQTKAEQDEKNWSRYVWGVAASYAALMASKYYPFFLSIIAGYYNAFAHLPGKKWVIGNQRWIRFFLLMGIVFVVLNPTILLPETWHEMLKFSSEKRIGHDSYEFMGVLYPHKMTDWLGGVPWTFYYVFIAVKTSLITLIFFLIGLPLMFRRRMGDGRIFMLCWAFFWFMPFTVLGGKFTRYFTFAEPLILITAAVGFCYVIKQLSERIFVPSPLATAFQTIMLAAFITAPLINSLSATPHFRLFTNAIGGGMSTAETYFPHDDFYDTSTKEIVDSIMSSAGENNVVACETPELFDYYANKNAGKKLTFVSLSDKSSVAAMKSDDYIVIVTGRRYFSNKGYEEWLEKNAIPNAVIKVGSAISARIYRLDDTSLTAIQAIAKQ